MGDSVGETTALKSAFSAAPDISAVLSWPQVVASVTTLERAGEIQLAYRLVKPKPEVAEETTRSIINERLQGALENEAKCSSSPCKVIGLGQDCMAADLGTKWGFGSLLVDGPFIAGVFSRNGSATALEDGLIGFVECSYHKLTRTPSGLNALTIPKYHAFLNHEVGPYWIDRSTDRIVGLYARRVAAFREALAKSPVLFVFSQTREADPDRLAQALDQFSPGANFRILVVDHSEDSAFAKEFRDGRVSYMASRKPRADYVWHVPSCYNTPEGLAFERPIAQSLMAALERFAS
ncbi:MAG TPA: hypothetical protein VHT03_10295 [Rhizomicrobium sp.]|jgi:hypothetical protein|nr:hypothetical protein [Rhizomicrobium sp.]